MSIEIYKALNINNVTLEEYPFLWEITMQSFLLENPEILDLPSEDLYPVKIVNPELQIKEGRSSKNKDGRIDILAEYGDYTIGVIEIKKGVLEEKDIDQISDYITAIKKNISKIEGIKKMDNYDDLRFVGVLVGSGIKDDLKNQLNGGKIIDENVPLSGIVIRRYRDNSKNIYVAKSTYCRFSGRDYTRYKYRNNVYGKGRLVLEIIRDYIENNSNITYQELVAIFYKKIQGSIGCIATKEEIENRRMDITRFYNKSYEIIKTASDEIMVCNQWGIKNIQNFIKKAEELGYKIEKIE